MRRHKYSNNPKDLLEQGKRIVAEKVDNEDSKFVYLPEYSGKQCYPNNFFTRGLLPL